MGKIQGSSSDNAVCAICGVRGSDERITWCAKIREEAAVSLAPGKMSMKSLSLGYGASTDNRVVLKIGDEAPQFAAANVGDKSVSLADFRDREYVVLLFSRAHW